MAEWMAEWWIANAKPLVHALFSLDSARIREAVSNAPHAYYEYIRKIYERNPEHVIVETFLIVFIIYITLFKKSYDPNQEGTKLTEKEVTELCNEWKPEPLISEDFNKDSTNSTVKYVVTESGSGTHVKIRDIADPVLQFVSFDLLGIGSRQEIKDAAVACLKKYGCGSCGPRGFYGSIDTHIEFEQELATFMGVPDCCLYSDSSSTVTSVIPAFAKRGDLVVCDKGANESIHVGIHLARCQALFYNHNDIEDLERILKEVHAGDKKAGRKSNCQRRYIVTEGIFRDGGDIAKLPAILALGKKYCFRLIIDESISFGTLGHSGRGITEFYNISIKDIDVICGSLSHALGSVGGFSIGSQEVVDYQRMNSASYVFSASSPPFLSHIASLGLKIIKNEPELIKSLSEKAQYIHQVFSQTKGFIIKSHKQSPVIHVGLSCMPSSTSGARRIEVENILERIADECLKSGILVVPARHVMDDRVYPPPTFRIVVNALHTTQQLDQLVDVLRSAAEKVLEDFTISDEGSEQFILADSRQRSHADTATRKRNERKHLGSQ